MDRNFRNTWKILAATATCMVVVAGIVSGTASAASFNRYSKNLSAGNGHSASPAINEAGDYVAFVTSSTNIAPGLPGTPQVVRINMRTGQMKNVSVSSNGEAAVNPTADMSIVNPFGMSSSAIDSTDPTLALVSGADLSAVGPSVTFTSTATNLVAGDTNGMSDVFIHGRRGDMTERISVSSSGQQANGPSWGAVYGYNSRWVAFISAASNLVKGDNNGQPDAFLRDLSRKKTVMVSINNKCKPGNGPVTDVAVSEGRYVAFSSTATNLVRRDTNRVSDVFLHKMFEPRKRCGVTTRQSVKSNGQQANGPSDSVSLGGNGKYLAYESTATNLVRGDTNGVQDIFWRIRTDRAEWLTPHIKGPKTLRVSIPHLHGGQANGPSSNPEITVAGRFIYFDSQATNIFPKEDTDTISDIYHHDLKSKWTTLSSRRDGKACQSGAFECSEGTPLGGVDAAVSYHGTDVVFLSAGKVMREQTPPTGTPGVVDIVMRYLGPMSAPVPREYR